MKKYNKNYLIIGAYFIALLLLICGMYFPDPNITIVSVNPLISGVAIILILYGIFSSYINIKESKLIGYIVILAGLVMLYFLLPVIANFLLAFTPV